MRRAVLVPLVVATVLGITLAALVFRVEPTPAATLPPGFEDRPVTDVQQPTALAFLPDRRMLIATQPGLLQLYNPATKNKRNLLDLSGRICSNSERGLLGVAVDPDFASNRHVYLYYTKKVGDACDGSPDDVNRISRFTVNADATALSDEKVLVDNIPSPGGNHNGGDLHFGKDGYLYASVGDGGRDYKGDSGGAGNNDAARDKNVLLGKILRVTREGDIPPDNPYAQASNGDRCGVPSANGRTAPGNVCKETFAMGLRNPFRMAFDPDSSATRFHINDVGQNAWEEIDAGKKGADYAWNICEGRHDNPDRAGSRPCAEDPFTPPVHEYNHTTGCSSITGGAFVPNAGPWPAGYDRSYLFGDYVCGKIFRLYPRDGGGYARQAFATGLGRGGPVAMTFGPSGQDLYYTTYAGENPGGEIRRISYTAGNRAPVAAAGVERNYDPDAPYEFRFNGSRSTDPDGDSLTYAWDFDYDGQTFQADPASRGQSPSHTYPAAGKKTAALRVTDANGLSDIATVEVFPGDTPPRPTIQSPAAGERFRVGQRLTARGSATDAERQGAPALEWEVIRHHNNSHTHPYKSGTGADLTFIGPEPEDLSATNPSGNYLEVRLTATEPDGLSRTVSRRLEPRTTGVTLASRPTGLRLVVNGRAFVAPRTFLSWEGDDLTVNAPDQARDGRSYVFRSWSDGRARQHVIDVPAEYKKYTANFRRR